MSKKVLVIAGGGFLGKRLLYDLMQNGITSIACSDLVDPDIKGVDFHLLNLITAGESEVQKLISNYDIIVNCSGQITKPINACLKLNTEGIQKIAKAVKAANKFLIHFSSVTVYGSCKWADEGTPLNPETPYSACKAFAEYCIESTLPADQFCILRLSNLYGEEQRKGVFSYLKRSLLSDKKLEFDNDGSLLRYYLHVDDCSGIIVQLIRSDKTKISGTYNLIGPEKYTIRQLIALCEKQTGSKFITSFADTRLWDTIDELSDEKIKNTIPIQYKRSVSASFLNFLNAQEK